jgi:hypothetical protein
MAQMTAFSHPFLYLRTNALRVLFGRSRLTVTDANGMQLTKGTDYTVTLSPAIVQRPGNYTLTIVGTGNETVGYFGSKTVNFTVTNVLSGNGEQDNPYMLNDDVDWDTFASNINDGTSYSGKFVKLGGNITINTMAATIYTKSFSGTFDGDGKTMTLDLTATSDGCAPFLYLYNATVKNLNIDGRITTGHRFGASIAAHIYGSTNYIQNCTSTVEITSTFAEANTDGTHGGFVAVNDAGTLNISDCVFAGKLLGANASSNGGFVGWNENTKVNYTDCLFAPAQITMSDENSCTFNRNGKNTFTNTYYLTQFGEAQGTQAKAALSESETVPTELSGTAVFRREFTGGKPSTVVFPFAHEATTNSDWSFVGTYETKVWTASDCGNDYGFAATNGVATDGVSEVKAGDFVKLAAGAWIRPMRSYLTYTGSGNPFASARGSESNDNGMPNSISVILVSADGETTELKTTDFTDFTDSGAWYTLDGRKLNCKPTKAGLYIHNGNKVIIK